MIKALVLMAIFLSLWAQSLWCYSFKQAKDDFIKDSKEVFLKDLKTSVAYDFLEKDFKNRIKYGLSTGLCAYRFIGVDILGIYTPYSSDSVAEGGIAFPVRLGYIPMGRGTLLKDYINSNKDSRSDDPTLLDRIKIGFYGSQNLTTGKFGFGLNLGIVW